MNFDLNDLLGGLFGGGRGGATHAGGGFRRQQMPVKGEDAQYEIEITLDEAYHGAERLLTLTVNDPCPTCHGTGVVENRNCPTCHGAGVLERQKTLTVKIPKGVKDGAKIRLAGKGGPGLFGGPPGDLYLIPRILPHSRFERQGDDLYVDVPVPFPDAGAGCGNNRSHAGSRSDGTRPGGHFEWTETAPARQRDAAPARRRPWRSLRTHQRDGAEAPG